MNEINRRDALKWMGASAAMVSSAGLWAACGGDDTSSTTTASSSAAADAVASSETGPIHNLSLLTNEYNSVMGDAAEKTAKILGLDYSETVFEGDETVALNQAEQAIASGAKMMFVQGADGSGIPKIARTAQDGQVYFSNIWTTAPWHSPFEVGDYYSWFFAGLEQYGFYEATKSMLTQVADNITESGKILYVTGFPGSSIDTIRTVAAKKALSEFPGMELVGTLDGLWSAEGGQKAAEDMISKYGEPDGLIAQNDSSLTGALAALKGVGMQPGENVFACAGNGEDTTLKQIQAGEVAATSMCCPAHNGVASVVRVYDSLNGVEWSPLERQMGFVTFAATPDNIDGIIERYVDNENLPFDPVLMSKHLSPDDWDPQIEFQPLNMKEYWTSGGFEEPAGFKYPEPYVKAMDAGDFDKVTQEYADHYKIKIDDFEYPGVPA